MWETVGTAVGNVGTDRKKRVSHEIFAFIHRGFYVNAAFLISENVERDENARDYLLKRE